MDDMIIVILKGTGKKNLLKNNKKPSELSGGFFMKIYLRCIIESTFLVFLPYE